jgi:hypothetical protein
VALPIGNTVDGYKVVLSEFARMALVVIETESWQPAFLEADTKGSAEHHRATLGPIERQRGRQEFPILHSGKNSMTISGRYIHEDARQMSDAFSRLGSRIYRR